MSDEATPKAEAGAPGSESYEKPKTAGDAIWIQNAIGAVAIWKVDDDGVLQPDSLLKSPGSAIWTENRYENVTMWIVDANGVPQPQSDPGPSPGGWGL